MKNIIVKGLADDHVRVEAKSDFVTLDELVQISTTHYWKILGCER